MEDNSISQYIAAVEAIKAAILKSQARAAQAVNSEQLLENRSPLANDLETADSDVVVNSYWK